MKIDHTDKRVLVTGGTRGIGRGIVEAFLEAGARVAVNGSSAESTAKAVAELDAGQFTLRVRVEDRFTGISEAAPVSVHVNIIRPTEIPPDVAVMTL